MKTFMVLALAALAHARPEPPSGYNYQRPIAPAPPQVVYGQPSFNGDSSHHSSAAFRPELSLGSSGSSFGSSQGSGSFGGSFGSSGPSFGSLGSSGSSFGSSGGSFGSSGGSFGSSGGSLGSSGGGFGSSGGSFGSSGGSFGSGSSSFGSSSFGGSSGQSFHQQQNLAPIIQKHIYVHVPPPEPIEEQKHFINQAIAPRKNYKIIFIKAPTAPAVSQQILQQQQEIQEKTIVYVLVKKPDEQEALQLSGIAPTKPSKPEVYFIKYKTQKDHGLSGSGSGGGGAISGLDLSSGIGSSSSIGSSSIGLSGVSSSSSQSIIGSNYGPPGQSGPY